MCGDANHCRTSGAPIHGSIVSPLYLHCLVLRARGSDVLTKPLQHELLFRFFTWELFTFQFNSIQILNIMIFLYSPIFFSWLLIKFWILTSFMTFDYDSFTQNMFIVLLRAELVCFWMQYWNSCGCSDGILANAVVECL